MTAMSYSENDDGFYVCSKNDLNLQDVVAPTLHYQMDLFFSHC